MEERLYRTFYDIEKSHWWFVARQRILKDIIERRAKLAPGSRVLDIGCGTGAFLEMLSRDYQAYGTDSSSFAVELCRKRGLQHAYQCTLETFPHQALRFDLITLLDVIEHIEHDAALLRQASAFLKPGGCAIITVPAYQFLWSRHDEVNQHKRRYVKSTLRRVLEGSGFHIEMISYFNTILFPAALASRLAERIFRPAKDTTLDIPRPAVNKILTSIFAGERLLLRALPLPYGLSLLAFCRRPV